MTTQYPVTGRVAGEEGSITNQGRYLTFVESDLTHPTHSDGLADKGDPVNVGNIVGVVSSSSPTAATDLVTVDTEGVWYLNVVASDDAGTSAVVLGDQLFIAAGVISKKASGVPFGKALGALSGSATAAVCAVKIHQEDPLTSLSGRKFVITTQFAAAEITAGRGIFIAPAACELISVVEAHGTIAGQAGTLQLEKCNTGEAKTAGDAMLASAFNLESTVNTPVTIAAVTDGKQQLVAGDEIRLKLASGASTSYVDGVATLLMKWL
nr:capsid cement protein [uncultured Methanoregula sp.]